MTARSNPPTICRCGGAMTYHRPIDRRDHEYEPRYEPMAWTDGYNRGREEGAGEAATEAYRNGFRDGSNQAARRIGGAITALASPHYPEV